MVGGRLSVIIIYRTICRLKSGLRGGHLTSLWPGHLHIFGRLRPEMVRGAGFSKNLRQYRTLSSNVPLAYDFVRRYGVIRRVRTFKTFR